MSSASSTARWIDCTVDSMLTTTPFFRPREGCEPRPSTSIAPSAPISPTSATTLEVPMSSPTMRLRSERLSILASVVARAMRAACPASRWQSRCCSACRRRRCRRRAARRASIAVIMKRSKRSSTWRLPRRTVMPLARSSSQAPRSSSRRAPSGACPPRSGALRRRDSARRRPPACPRDPRAAQARAECGVASLANSSPRVLSSPLSPQRAAATCSTTSTVSPRGQARCTLTASTQGSACDRAPHRLEIHRHQARAAQPLLDRALDIAGRDALEAPGDRDTRSIG